MSVIKLTSERPSGFSNDLQRVLCAEGPDREIELMRKEKRERERKNTRELKATNDFCFLFSNRPLLMDRRPFV